MINFKYRLIVVASAFALPVACSAPSSVGRRSAPIINGTVSAPGKDPSVVCVFKDGACSSGTLISARVVLAAAHTVAKRTPASLRIFFGNDAFFGLGAGTWVNVVAVRTYKDADIALIKIDKKAPSKPIAVNRTALDVSVVAKPVRLVGFGITAPDRFDVNVKREGTSTVDSLSDKPVVGGTTWPNKGLVVYVGHTGARTCLGDSGGPYLARRADGVEHVIAVGSFGTISDAGAKCAAPAGGSRVDIPAVRAWLDSQLSTLDPPGCGADGRCAMGCTPPDPDCSAADASSVDAPLSARDGGRDVPVGPRDAARPDATRPDATTPDAEGGSSGAGSGGCAFAGGDAHLAPFGSRGCAPLALLLLLFVFLRSRRSVPVLRHGIARKRGRCPGVHAARTRRQQHLAGGSGRTLRRHLVLSRRRHARLNVGGPRIP